MSPAELRPLLLDLIGTGPQPDLAQLSPDDWQVLDAMAGQHRLQPLLHVQHRANPAIDPEIAGRWAAAFRFQSILALRQKADLAATVALLREGGFPPTALKGAWLAWHVYPQAAMRPLRDVDLLLDSATVIPAYELLTANGYHIAADAELSLHEALLLEKHLPPLFAPGGTCIELHHRLWEPDGRMDHASPLEIDAAVRAAAVTEADGISYPAPIDMLAHLIAHAIYSHRLDCGPLLLTDIDLMLQRRAIDWTTFWHRAEREGWCDGARLVLELVARYRPAAPIQFSADAASPVPAAILAEAPQLLLQDLTMRKSAGALASVRKQGLTGLVNRLLGRRSARAGPSVQREMKADGGYFGWIGNRLRRTAGDLAQSDVRYQARAMAELSRWLDQPR
ncbi:nucleotidyltransferase family protein [Novosphingobium sp.]|uniref:nucleotidyltransferase family protein n=1 Tax=Novosphingobium sp. TaxID=1874826 RepID=UPI002732EE28|nr:nucleotidyltransferase family protein [Novosphingobium sp.]MDP3906636.1 nucleotidyltransferase family protein [Novosphingobium sp.]